LAEDTGVEDTRGHLEEPQQTVPHHLGHIAGDEREEEE